MMKKKLPVWLLWPFAVFLLGIWHLLVFREYGDIGRLWGVDIWKKLGIF